MVRLVEFRISVASSNEMQSLQLTFIIMQVICNSFPGICVQNSQLFS